MATVWTETEASASPPEDFLTAAARKAKGALRYISDPRERYFHRQRRVLDQAKRRTHAARIAAKLPRIVDNIQTPTDTAIERDGIASLQPLLTASEAQEARDYFAMIPAHDPYRPELGRFLAPDAVPHGSRIAYYANGDILGAPHLLAAANEPELLASVTRYLGARPTLTALDVRWSLPGAGELDKTQLFHRDFDDFAFLKLFVYLTDVDHGAGPHVYAAGSHRRRFLTGMRRYSVGRVETAVGPGAIRTVTGPAGTSFIADTYGLHRGLPPTERPRLIFQALYALRPLPYGPRRPLAQLPAGLDPYINRVFHR